jgi:hypothetical protein
MWNQCYAPENKSQCKEWNHPSSPMENYFKPQSPMGKKILTFGDSQGPTIKTTETCLQQKTVQIQRNDLAPVQTTNHKHTPWTGVEECHNFAQQCPSAQLCPHHWKPSSGNFKVLKHPLYRFDACLSEPPGPFEGRHLVSGSAVKNQCLSGLSLRIYVSERIKKPVDSWSNCVKKKGHCARKLC